MSTSGSQKRKEKNLIGLQPLTSGDELRVPERQDGNSSGEVF